MNTHLTNSNSMQSPHQAWFSNVGPLVEPLTKTEFEAGSKPVPQALFAHNTQTSITQAVFAQDSNAGGVLGRLGDVLNEQEGNEIFAAYSISGTPKILEGAPGVNRPADVLSGYGETWFNYLIYDFGYEMNIEALNEQVRNVCRFWSSISFLVVELLATNANMCPRRWSRVFMAKLSPLR